MSTPKSYPVTSNIKNCPCCGSRNLRIENLVVEGGIQCKECRLSLWRKHSSPSKDDGLEIATKAWNKRVRIDKTKDDGFTILRKLQGWKTKGYTEQARLHKFLRWWQEEILDSRSKV
jgi:hypothetical protein